MRPPKGPDPSASSPLDLIRRGAVELISDADLQKKLALHRPLVIKAGFDPTAPDLHLGHTVLLRKLRHFQDLDHTVIFLIGDATALVGDPSGQSVTRKVITREEVEANATTYLQQISRILDVQKIKTAYNSDWFLESPRSGRSDKLPFAFTEFVTLASKITVARLIERDDFSKRLKAGKPISFLELFYPIMQAYDSVMIARRYGSCDVELGGTDQKFNLLMGRDLLREYGQEPQVVITMPLLEGTDGVQKMSKSLGNHIGITDPPGEMFGKLMSIPDILIVKYFTLLTDISAERITELERQLKTRAVNPRDAKVELAETIVRMYHGAEPAAAAKQEFAKVFSRREQPTQIPEHVVADIEEGGSVELAGLLVGTGLAKTKNDARRLLKQGSVKLNGTRLTQSNVPAAQVNGAVLQVGRHFRKLVSA